MASFFDSPLFWIIVVWWLLSILLGAKARRRRREMQAQAAPPDQPPAPFVGAREEGEPTVSPGQERPVEIKVEGEVLEAQPLTSTPEPQEYPSRARPSARLRTGPAPPSRPVSPLEDLFRGLGITEDRIPPALRPERETFPPEEPVPAPAPMPEISPEPPPIEPTPARAKEYVPPPPRRRYPLLAETTLARLTPLQQAMVLKEVLDRPRAQRRSIR